ncbi:alpha/beta-hydrolase [Wolfiporia cocos MD-104 SS10]|uniref:Alpha/beta-hydrolase n=1 Tax=Wolfiporia cocos (strain MD-104) TaxID=742152 RepID=A0A2H3ISV2_WOLCO|nr:alpha/beta-hydrolase [Wolfiporia cocos MD-104 SS10]
MTTFTTNTVVFSYPEASRTGLKVVAKNYTSTNPAHEGLTILLTHCTGAHKEIWEPVLDTLFKRSGSLGIREVWAVDWQNHGEAAVVNESILEDVPDGLSIQEYAVGLRAFVASPYLAGCRNIIGIGHSAGTSALLLSADLPTIPYAAIILVEPCLCERNLWHEHYDEHMAQLEFMQEAINGRRDVWRDRVEAAAFFRKRIPWQAWDSRVIDVYVKYGLRDVVVKEDGREVKKVTLKCNKTQERKTYSDDNEPHFVAGDLLGTLDASLPIHCIFGTRVDFVPLYAHESIQAVRKMASVQRVPKAGHFAVQENPDGVAACIEQIFSGIRLQRAKL